MASSEMAAPADNADDEVSLLDWLRVVAAQNVPEALQSAAVPVAWLGRTSTDDLQDPTLSLPRQLESVRQALPGRFVTVANFYDVESGRTAMTNHGMGNGHEQFDIPIPRDESIADHRLTEPGHRPEVQPPTKRRSPRWPADELPPCLTERDDSYDDT